MNQTVKAEIDAIVEIVNKENPGKIIKGNESPKLERISTGSLELDYITGGGIPIGRWTRFYGGPMSCKSLVSINVIANAQKMGMTCAYIDAENQYDSDWFEKHGVDTENLTVVNSSIIEEIGEIIEALMPHIDLFVIDSCSICVSRINLEDGLNERQYYGGTAKQWKTQFVHLNGIMDKHRNTVIYLDHVNVSFGNGGITSMAPPGGENMKFIASLTLEFKQGKWLWERDGVFTDVRDTKQKTLSGGNEADGLQINIRTHKSRVAKPFQTAILYFDLNRGRFDWVEEYFKAAKYSGIVEGGSWVKYDDDKEKSYRPKDVKQRIREDEEFRERIKATLLISDNYENKLNTDIVKNVEKLQKEKRNSKIKESDYDENVGIPSLKHGD